MGQGHFDFGIRPIRNWMFESTDRNADLVDEFFRREGVQDQYWISISFPDDQFNNWEEQEIEILEEEIREDFGYDGYKATLDLEHGREMPRSVPLFWFLMLKENETS
jgi:hypothetical protein